MPENSLLPTAAAILVRPLRTGDFGAWHLLWDAYNSFYGRAGATALPADITQATWRRFFDPGEPVFGLVAESRDQLVGLAHYIFHRSTTRIELTCYLQDLFTVPAERGRGVGRSLIEGVCRVAGAAGLARVYWQTQGSNAIARVLYDRMASHNGFIVYEHAIAREEH